MHTSVLLQETMEYLNLKRNSVVVDATLGYGGHSSVILKHIPDGFLYAFDQDQEAIQHSKVRLSKVASNFKIIHSNFVNLKEELVKQRVSSVDAVLFDLGVSSPQLDEPERGFSYRQDAPLDMRMDRTTSLTADMVVNTYSKEELVRLLKEYGEERHAVAIVNKIIKARPIHTTLELADIVKSAVPSSYARKHHPARKTFQAIRIEVNRELEVLDRAFRDALKLLKPNGRLCVITFHSLEDKTVKQIMKEVSQPDPVLKRLPILEKDIKIEYQILANISPSKEEIETNYRAHSARLRVIERRDVHEKKQNYSHSYYKR